jgi:hypothetical protein
MPIAHHTLPFMPGYRESAGRTVALQTKGHQVSYNVTNGKSSGIRLVVLGSMATPDLDLVLLSHHLSFVLRPPACLAMLAHYIKGRGPPSSLSPTEPL